MHPFLLFRGPVADAVSPALVFRRIVAAYESLSDTIKFLSFVFGDALLLFFRD